MAAERDTHPPSFWLDLKAYKVRVMKDAFEAALKNFPGPKQQEQRCISLQRSVL